MLNEKILMNILKNNTEAVIGFTNNELTEVLIADNTFMLIISVEKLKPNGAVMRLVKEAKLAILSTNNVVDKPCWCIKTKQIYDRKVTDYFKVFEHMQRLESEKQRIVPFSLKSLEEPKTEEVLFINENDEYVAFDAKYIEIFKNLNNIKDGLLVSRSYLTYNNDNKKSYGLLIKTEDCKFLVMGLNTVNPNIVSYLR